jgi:hypothetical protein
VERKTMENSKQGYDVIIINGKPWLKNVMLGPKAWKNIEENGLPGKFIDVLQAKFKNFAGKPNTLAVR